MVQRRNLGGVEALGEASLLVGGGGGERFAGEVCVGGGGGGFGEVGAAGEETGEEASEAQGGDLQDRCAWCERRAERP